MLKGISIGVLYGRQIQGFRLSDDRKTIILSLEHDRHIIGKTWGDCCSQTWIESIDMPGNLYGTLVSIEDIEMPDLGDIKTPNHETTGSVRYYGVRITTTSGIAVIDYRNDSNGYYGGNIAWYVAVPIIRETVNDI